MFQKIYAKQMHGERAPVGSKPYPIATTLEPRAGACGARVQAGSRRDIRSTEIEHEKPKKRPKHAFTHEQHPMAT
jgi:hypothetical protein